MRGTNGAAFVPDLDIAMLMPETTVPNFVNSNVDFSGGDGCLVGNLTWVAVNHHHGYRLCAGQLHSTGGTLDALNYTNGWQRTLTRAHRVRNRDVNGTASRSAPTLCWRKPCRCEYLRRDGTSTSPTAPVRGNTMRRRCDNRPTSAAAAHRLEQRGSALLHSGLNLTGASLRLKARWQCTSPHLRPRHDQRSHDHDLLRVERSQFRTNHLISYTGATPFAGLSRAITVRYISDSPDDLIVSVLSRRRRHP